MHSNKGQCFSPKHFLRHPPQNHGPKHITMKHFFSAKPAISIFSILVALIGIGIIMIYSSSTIYAERYLGNRYYFLIRQLLHLVIGMIFLWFAVRYPYSNYKRLIPFLMIVSFVLMVLVLVPGIGKQVGNARRWIRFFGIGIQPSEVLKFTLIVWVAGFLERKKTVLGQFSQGLLPSLLMIAIFCFLLLLQPDFGTSILIALTLLTMIFVAGVKPFHMFGSVLGFLGISILLVVSESYRMKRIFGFLDPWADPLDAGFQLIQSLVAVGTGGILGRDLGNSRQKLFFLPEGHTDFIFSILAEEAGFIGVTVVVGLLIYLMIKGFQVALHRPDDFGRNLAFGVTTMIILQSFLNIGVVIGLLPTKGIPLPFISYGGSSLVMNIYMVGVLINISKYGKKPI